MALDEMRRLKKPPPPPLGFRTHPAGGWTVRESRRVGGTHRVAGVEEHVGDARGLDLGGAVLVGADAGLDGGEGGLTVITSADGVSAPPRPRAIDGVSRGGGSQGCDTGHGPAVHRLRAPCWPAMGPVALWARGSPMAPPKGGGVVLRPAPVVAAAGDDLVLAFVAAAQRRQ